MRKLVILTLTGLAWLGILGYNSAAGTPQPPLLAVAPAGGTGQPGDAPSIPGALSNTTVVTPSLSCSGWDAVPLRGSVAGAQQDDAWAATGSMIERWNGSAWTPTPYSWPFPYYFHPNFTVLAARRWDDAWTGGVYYGSPNGSPWMIEHWDGQNWSVLAAPVPTGKKQPDGTLDLHDDYLAYISPVGPDAAWAFGYRSQAPAANHAEQIDPLYIVCVDGSCRENSSGGPNETIGPVSGAGPNDVWSVGGNDHTAIRHWDGAVWSAVASPDIGPLTGVAALAADDVWAVGNGGTLHWNGATWTQVPSPTGLRYIAATGADAVWAAGDHNVLHWAGATWTIMPSPNVTVTGIVVAAPPEVWVRGEDSPLYSILARYRLGAPYFDDVPVSQPFYSYAETLACHGAVSGYACGAPGEVCPGVYYRPGAAVTRGQLAKIVAQAAGFNDDVSGRQTFADAPPAQPFWLWIERLALRGAVSGYTCGGPGEPCDAQRRPYFRPSGNATRGEISKITAVAAELGGPPPPDRQTFADVPPSAPFWRPIEQLAALGAVSGYSCSGPGEPCDAQGRPYFRPHSATTRGQLAKITAGTFLPNGASARTR